MVYEEIIAGYVIEELSNVVEFMYTVFVNVVNLL